MVDCTNCLYLKEFIIEPLNEKIKRLEHKNFKLTEGEAKSLIWTMILEEDEEVFTSEFRKSVSEVVRKIREAI